MTGKRNFQDYYMLCLYTPTNTLPRGQCGGGGGLRGVLEIQTGLVQEHMDTVYRTGQSRFYFYNAAEVLKHSIRTMLRMFFESVVASAITCAVVCWGSTLRVRDVNILNHQEGQPCGGRGPGISDRGV